MPTSTEHCNAPPWPPISTSNKAAPDQVENVQHEAPPLLLPWLLRRPAATTAAALGAATAAAAGHAVWVAPGLQQGQHGGMPETPAAAIGVTCHDKNTRASSLRQSDGRHQRAQRRFRRKEQAHKRKQRTPGSTALSPLMPKKKPKGTRPVVMSRKAAMYSTAHGAVHGSMQFGWHFNWTVTCPASPGNPPPPLTMPSSPTCVVRLQEMADPEQGAEHHEAQRGQPRGRLQADVGEGLEEVEVGDVGRHPAQQAQRGQAVQDKQQVQHELRLGDRGGGGG